MGIETSGHDHIKALLPWQLSALSPPRFPEMVERGKWDECEPCESDGQGGVDGGGVAPTVICEIRHKGEGDGEQKEDTAVLYIM